MRAATSLTTVVFVVAALRSARAQPALDPAAMPELAPERTPPEPDHVPAFTPHQLVLRLAGELGSTSSIAPDIWLALNDRFRFGITTSTSARRELGSSRGICVHACPVGTFAGTAADAEVRLGPTLVGRAALDATRLLPTAVALELGADSVHTAGRWTAQLSPVLRIGFARRDLANTDAVAVFARFYTQAWASGGIGAVARVAVSLDALRDTPSLGAAFEAWQAIDHVTVSLRAGMAELARSFTRDALFAELAIAWAI